MIIIIILILVYLIFFLLFFLISRFHPLFRISVSQKLSCMIEVSAQTAPSCNNLNAIP